MSAPLSPTRLFVCDGCQTPLPFDPADAGKEFRCGKCGKVLVVPGTADESERKPKPPATPQYIELWCRVCDTRMVARGADAGKKAKCPDCGAANVVPTPKQPVAPREPPAMRGQQYGIWEVNKAPDPQEMRAGQPKLFPVYCRVCDTLMYAQHKYIGGQLRCPDCGALTVVKAPPKEPEKKSVLVPAGQEYKIDPAQRITSSAVPEYVERLKRESKIAVEEEAKRREQERPKMPMFPTLVGVWSMLFRNPIPTWWVGLSAGGVAVAFLLLASIPPPSARGMTLMFCLMCRIFGFLTALLWYGPTAAIWCAITAESSEGHRKLHASPSPYFFDCLMEMVYIGTTVSLSCIPGFVAMSFLSWQYTAAIGAGSFVLLFPLLLLSAFQENTAMGIFSPRIWGSLAFRPAHWLFFYIQSGIIGASGAAICAGIILKAPEWMLATVPVALATAFLYFRVLGRFAWWLAESLPAKEGPHIEPGYRRF